MWHFVFNFLHRWRWVYACGAVFQLQLLLTQHGSMHGTQSQFAGAGVFLGPLLLLLDFRHDMPRPLATLPMTLRQTGRGYWIVAVAVPSTITFIVISLCNLLTASLGRPMMTLEAFLLTMLAAVVVTGTAYWIGMHTPSEPQVVSINWHTVNWAALKAGFFSVLWGGAVGGCLFFMDKIPRTWHEVTTTHLIVFCVLSLFTVHAWVRADILAAQRFGTRLATNTAVKSTSQAVPAPWICPKGGFIQIIKSNILLSLGGASLAVVMFLIVQGINGGNYWAIMVDVDGKNLFNLFPLVFFMAISCCFGAVRWMISLRTWRILPIAHQRLALMLTSMPMVPAGILALLLMTPFVFLGQWNKVEILGKGMLQTGAILTFIVPSALRFNTSRWLMIAVIYTFIALPAALWVLQMKNGLLGWPVTLLGVAAIAGLANCWTAHLLRNRCEAYRNCINPFGPTQS